MKHTQIARLVALLVGSAAAGSAMASAFQLLEQNATGIGNAYSGTAASTEDASAAFFNPALMPMMERPNQASLAIDLIKPTSEFQDNGSLLPPTRITNKGGNGGDIGDWTPVPATHITYALNKQWSLGFSVGAPFGLKTEYDPDWMGRFHAVKSDLKTINLNPSVAYRINDMVSIGGGLSYQHFEAELTQAVNFSALMCASPTVAALCAGGLLNNYEGYSQIKGESDDWGWNIGAAFQFSPSTRVGVSYRAAIKHKLTGNVTFTHPTVALPAGVPNAAATSALLNASIRAAAPSGPVEVEVELPDTLTISAFQQIDDKWSIQGDIARTGWSSIETLDIYRSSGALLSSSYYKWKDSWRVAVGGAYQYSPTLKLRAGLAYDQSPVEDDYRAPRLPDNDRTWLSFGLRYAVSPAMSIDAGYSHLFVKTPTINDAGYHADYNPGGINTANPVTRGTIKGEYENSVDIFAVQFNYAF